MAAYRDFSGRVKTLIESGLSKPQKIAQVIKSSYGEISKAQILEKCPYISQVTVQRTLNELLKNNDIIRIGGGRYTKYVWNREKND